MIMNLLIFGEFILSREQTKQFPSWAILKQEVQLPLILEAHLKLDEEGMLNDRKDLLLRHYMLLLILFEDVFLLEHLQCIELVVLEMPHQ